MKRMRHNGLRKDARPDGYAVPLMKSAFTEEKATRRTLARFVLTTEKLSMGEQCAAFEKHFAKKQGSTDAILFNSGGSANLAMLQALKNLGRLKEGDAVGFSAVTWSTNVMPIIQMGFRAVPIDCNPQTLNSDSKTAIPSLKENKCKAFFITNALGFTGDLDAIRKACKKLGIILLEDNCESLGTELPTGRAGNFGLASSFSFFVAHHMSTIEGGMVCTNDTAYAEMLRIVRSNGWDRNLSPKRQAAWRKKYGITSDIDAKYTFYDLGFNLRPTEITGFLGLYQLPLLGKTLAIREKNFKLVDAALRKNSDFIPLDRSHIRKLPAFALSFVCKTPALKQRYMKRFAAAGIEVRPLIAGNMQRQPFYARYIKKRFSLPGADLLHENAFYCGNSPEYTEKELEIILGCIKEP